MYLAHQRQHLFQGKRH